MTSSTRLSTADRGNGRLAAIPMMVSNGWFGRPHGSSWRCILNRFAGTEGDRSVDHVAGMDPETLTEFAGYISYHASYSGIVDEAPPL